MRPPISRLLRRGQRKWFSLRFMSTDQEYIVKSPHPDVIIPKVPLHEYVWRNHLRWADKVAVESGTSGITYTYTQARERSRRIAAALQHSFNLKPGESFALISPNVPDYALIMLAASEAGLVCTTVNSTYTADEIAKQLKDSDAKLVIASPEKIGDATEAVRKINKNLPLLLVTDGHEKATGACLLDDVLSSSEVRKTNRDVNDVVVLPYSSGTTGLPKGVMLSHHNLVSNLEQLDSPGVRLFLQTTETQQDVVLGLLPAYHIYGMVVVALNSFSAGGKLVTVPKFDPKLFIQVSVQKKIGMMYLVPPLILFLAGHPEVKPEHLAYIRCIMTGAAPIGAQDLQRLRDKAPHITISQGYGLTETSPVVLNTLKSRPHKLASSGVPLPNIRMKIIDVETGRSLKPGEIGEICCEGPMVMKGYLNKPEETAQMISNGWLRTGDLGYHDEEGDFYVVDRMKELIKVKGLQVAPAEVEAVLRSHPSIADAAVIGVPHEKSGEVPRAFVVLKQGQSATETEIFEFVAKQLSKHKHLTGGITFLPAIPKSAAGKILRRELKAQFVKS